MMGMADAGPSNSHRNQPMSMSCFPPERIVCLTEETVETLYLLGEDRRIAGITGYAVRPEGVRWQKPRISAFTSANIPKIMALQPDLVLAFSDLQAELVSALVKQGVSVMAYNQRSVAEILAMIRHLGAMVGAADKAERLVAGYEAQLAILRAHEPEIRPKVYFEEWDRPMISSIEWVSELVRIAGGQDVFAALSGHQAASDRIVSSEDVIAAQPDIIIASWCGKKVRPEKIAARPGWDQIPAVKAGRIHEIKSSLILQPGPAALTDGLAAIVRILETGRQE